MRTTRGMRAALRRRTRCERGFAVPTVIMAVVIGLGLGGAAVTASIFSQKGSVRDTAAKRAHATPHAGAEVAIYRQNKVATTDTLRCIDESLGELVPGSPSEDGWCAATTGSVNGGTYTYRVKPWTLEGTLETGLKRQLTVVSVGTVDGVSRRVAVTAAARTGANIFGGAGAVGDDDVTVSGSADIGTVSEPTDASTNGNITTEGSATLCGNAHVGVGHEFIGGNQCPGYGQDEVSINLPPVDPGNVWNENDNGRFFGQDIVQPASAVSEDCSTSGNQSRVCWDPATRTLTMRGNARLTLGGSNYSLCRLDMGGNSQLIVAQGAVVNLFFHSPETCGLTGDPVEQITMSGNPRLNTTSLNAGDLRIMMVGSDSISTAVTFQGNPSAGGNDFTFYGPRTDVVLQGNPTYRGAVAAKTIEVGGSATLIVDDSALNADLAVALNYARERYVECTGGALPAVPDSSC